ncbi:MAG TPA: aminotransferase class V-fold PLP-dependent enzyme, partial [Clostridia bacterium]|nr:aminotransferase class V-fold PLP-dependent enzyme [Clostridia bacterium]
NFAQPEIMPDILESGTLNVPGIAGLAQGVRYVTENQKQITAHELELAGLLGEELRRINNVRVYSPLYPESGVVLFNIAGVDCTDVADILDKEYDIACRAGFHCAPLAHRAIGTDCQGGVRFSIGWSNTVDDIEQSVLAVKEIASVEAF